MNKGAHLTPEQALDQLEALYDRSVNALRYAIGRYIENGELPAAEARAQGLFVYPSLSVSWNGSATKPPKTRAYARFTHSGCYSTTVTRPALFRPYLLEQLTLLCQDYGAQIEVGLSAHEIPYPYVIDGSEPDARSLDERRSDARTSRPPSWRRLAMKPPMACTTRPTAISRCRILMPAAWISRWRACATTPARRSSISSRSCCSPTTPAMWMSLCAGAAPRSSIRKARISRSPARAGTWITAGNRSARSRRFPIWRGKNIRCRPGT